MSERAVGAVLAERLRGLSAAPTRFPVPLACAALWAAVTVADNHNLFNPPSDVDRLQVFLLLGLFLALAAKLFAESRRWRTARGLALTAAALGLLGTVVFLGPQPDHAFESPAFLFMGPGLVLLTAVAPFLRRGAESRDVWAFNFRSWTSAAFGLLIAVVLGLGMMALLAALEALFGLRIGGRFYDDVWIVCFSVVWPWQTLAGVPRGFGAPADAQGPRWFAYLVGWMLVPIALVYLAVLYAFAAKIAIQWALPQGQIGWLVAGFAGFGVAVWHAAYPLRQDGNRLVRAYVRFLHPALTVPAALLAVAVGTRIAEYGITENRYGLIVLAVWLAGTALHGIVARTPRLTVAPLSFAVLLILASFGPWGATAVSLRSQLARLDALLAEAGVLNDGRLSQPAAPVSDALAGRISGVVNYLNSPDKRQALHDRLRDGGIELQSPLGTAGIVAALGMHYLHPSGYASPHVSWRRSEPSAMDTRGFDAAVRLSLAGNEEESRIVTLGTAETDLHARMSGHLLEFSAGARGPVAIDLARLEDTLRRAGSTVYDDIVNKRLMTVEAHGNGLKVRVHFTYLSAESEEPRNLQFIALVGAADGP